MKKIVLITGATSGIGLAALYKFASNNYDCIFTYNNNLEKAENLKKEIEDKYKVKVSYYKCDLSSESDIDNLVANIDNLDVLVNNAGIAIDTLYEDKTKENFIKTLEVNLVGPFYLTKLLGEKISSGSIINISSTNAINSMYIESIDYDASKAALINMTKNEAIKYAPNIRVNAIAPGWVDTRMNENLDESYKQEEINKTLLNRFAHPEEIANVIYFLASEESSFITGETIVVDGGYKLK